MTLVVVPSRIRCVCGAAYLARRSTEPTGDTGLRRGAPTSTRDVDSASAIEVCRDPGRDLPSAGRAAPGSP
jgi:hypothetical protein